MVTYELLEEFTGTRVQEMPDPDNEGETLSAEVACRDVSVRFTCSDFVHERTVNVCFDGEGAYDEAATLVRIGEVGMGVEQKIECGAIS
tara:strand:- start:503 stop:769 length:267 start_codon:yes stop_codon:yes gene_type:complete